MSEFSHFSDDGSPVMVDISQKKDTIRVARAAGFVRMQPETVDKIEKRLLPKGDPFEIAKIAGVMGAKKTAQLIPRCHPLNINYVDLDIVIDEGHTGVIITSEVRLEGKTGVEMEALTAVSVAALTVYDMCKAVDKNISIENIRLIEKKGGKSGYFSQK